MKRFFLTKSQIEKIFDELTIDYNSRAQNITIPQWEAMTKIFFHQYFENLGR